MGNDDFNDTAHLHTILLSELFPSPQWGMMILIWRINNGRGSSKKVSVPAMGNDDFNAHTSSALYLPMYVSVPAMGNDDFNLGVAICEFNTSPRFRPRNGE